MLVSPTTDLQFSEPPVRSVVLTVYFEPIMDFGFLQSLKLSERWAADYSAIRQTEPRPRPREMPQVSVFADLEWPFPRIVHTHDSLSRALSYQFDQFSLRWTFGDHEQPNPYPGFESLLGELQEAFGYFAEVIDSESSTRLVVNGCGCEYVNSIEDLSVESWIVGYLTGWAATPGAPDSRTGAGRSHYGVREEVQSENSKEVCALEANARKDGTTLRIRATSQDSRDAKAEEGSELDNKSRIVEYFTTAHDLATVRFETTSSAAMKTSWELNSAD